MTSKENSKPIKSKYADAEAAAQNLSKDPGVKTSHVSGEAKAVPHYQHKDVTQSIRQEKLVCPQCGEPTFHAEFPDQFEAWLKCSSCDFFMGMSNDDWHRMENSPNINEKIKKMAKKQET
jgi:ribosomal protein S27AE